MKIFFYSLSIFSLFLFTQCSGKPDRPGSVLNETQKVYDGTDLNTPSAVAPPVKEPAQNAEGVWHYTCTNGCSGGAGGAQACATCSAMLVHNTVYHANDKTKNPAAVAGGNQISFDPNNPTSGNSTISFPNNGTSVTPTTTAPPTSPEPPQNTAGVWHYTCSNGCAGGGGGATACGSCGNTLAHNTLYHQ